MSLRRHPVQGRDAASRFRIPNFDRPIQRSGNDPLRFQGDAGDGVVMADQRLQVFAAFDRPNLKRTKLLFYFLLLKVKEWNKFVLKWEKVFVGFGWTRDFFALFYAAIFTLPQRFLTKFLNDQFTLMVLSDDPERRVFSPEICETWRQRTRPRWPRNVLMQRPLDRHLIKIKWKII